jgi:hypothetical protein
VSALTGQSKSTLHGEKCYACGRKFRDPNNRQDAFLIDDGHATVLVGPECFRRIVKGGDTGYQPPNGSPRLFITKEQAKRYVRLFGASA